MWTRSLRLPETPPAQCSCSSCLSCTFTKTDTRTPEHHLLASKAPVSFSLSDPSCCCSFTYSGALVSIRPKFCTDGLLFQHSCSLDLVCSCLHLLQVLLLFFEMHLQIWGGSILTCCSLSTGPAASASPPLQPVQTVTGKKLDGRLVPATLWCSSPHPLSLLQLRPQLREDSLHLL